MTARWGNRYERLGSGRYSQVYLHKDTERRWVAVKTIPDRDDGICATTMRELALLWTLKGSPHVVTLFETAITADQKKVSLAMEYAPLGTLKNWCERIYGDPHSPSGAKAIETTTTNQVLSLGLQLVMAVRYIHQKAIIHRDIKPQNLLLFLPAPGQIQLKIADFNISRSLLWAYESPDITMEVCSLIYRPPEVIWLRVRGKSHRVYGFGVDCWATGCVLYELFRGRPLFNAYDNNGLGAAFLERLGAPSAEEWPEVQDSAEFKLLFRPDSDSGSKGSDMITEPPPTSPALPPSPPPAGNRLERLLRPGISFFLPPDCAYRSAVIDLLGKLLLFNPQQRWTMEQAQEHTLWTFLSPPLLPPEATAPVDTTTTTTSTTAIYDYRRHADLSAFYPLLVAWQRLAPPPVTGQINQQCRAILLDWLEQVCRTEHSTYSSSVYYQTVAYLDFLLGQELFTKHNLQLLGCVCCYIAGRISLLTTIPIDSWCDVSDNSFKDGEFTAMVRHCLPLLQKDLHVSVASHFYLPTDAPCVKVLVLLAYVHTDLAQRFLASEIVTFCRQVAYFMGAPENPPRTWTERYCFTTTANRHIYSRLHMAFQRLVNDDGKTYTALRDKLLRRHMTLIVGWRQFRLSWVLNTLAWGNR